ncbi:MAG: glycosyltransferase family 4 protein [Alphaproteobacteria bacterium]|nr:glycosyltransferase family 4 protein [Alphaproteobacteria bacterium]
MADATRGARYQSNLALKATIRHECLSFVSFGTKSMRKAAKVYIHFPYRLGPYGGANQFFKALRGALRRIGRFSESPETADAVLFNSHHSIDQAIGFRKKNSKAIFIHRVDGPMRVYNSPSDKRDGIVALASHLLADATVFQSEWSRTENENAGWVGPPYRTLIGNAPDPEIFNSCGRALPPESLAGRGKVRIISSSWSPNPRKGFDVYAFLDETIDLDRFEFTFVGNSPYEFKRIRHLPPLESHALASELKQNDIFLAATLNDPCSNSLLEALACGLPVIARRSGGNPELVREGGLLFDEKEEVNGLMDDLAANYRAYVEAIYSPNIDEIARNYADFVDFLVNEQDCGRLITKKLSVFDDFFTRWRLRKLERS